MRIVVVGAGILGASTAYHLAREGAEVVVVDAEHAGRATAAGAGIICPWVAGDEDAAFYRLYAGGGEYYSTLIEELGAGDFGFRRVGAVLVSEDASELRAMQRVLDTRRAETPEMGEISLLSPGEARALFPPLARELGAVRVGGGARVDGRKLAAGLLAAAERHGATMWQGEARLTTAGDRVTGVEVGGDLFAADVVVAAAGVWAPELLQPLGLALPIAPQRGQIMHLQLVGEDTGRWPIVLPAGEHYLLAFEEGRIVAGATRESAGFDYRVTAGGLAEVLAQALAVAPGLAKATLLETRIGFRPVGPGIRPQLGAARGVEGLIIGDGLGAGGLTIGPYAGRLLADVALGRPTEIDLAPFDPLRPQAWEKVVPFLR